MKEGWKGSVIVFFLFIPAVCLAQFSAEPSPLGPSAPHREAAPSPLPHVKPEYEKMQYWIGRQASPDKILLSPEEIGKVNRQALKDDPESVDVFSLSGEMDSRTLAEAQSRERDRYSKLKLYDLTNQPVPSDYFSRLFSRMDLKGIPNPLKPVYAVVTRETNLRVFPTDDLIMDKPFDYAFDRFQSEKLDCGTPLAILHYTDDRTWCFVETGYTGGWIKPNDVAIGKREKVLKFARAEPLVVSGDSVPFYRDRELKTFAFDLPMGARLPLLGRAGDRYRVQLPWRDRMGNLAFVEGYVRADSSVHAGYLPYATGGVLMQAFKLKDSRYSWGGLGEGRDCSRFIMDIFRCFGFRMPRDSYRQAVFSLERRENVENWTESEKIALLRRHEGTPTILYMKGHVMLFLGIVDDKVYAIHSYWEYSRDEQPEVVYHVGRVVVSDLSLGKSGEGTLLRWITAVVPIR